MENIKNTPKKFPEDYSFWQWYLNWRYEVREPLIAMSGFSELLLKAFDGELGKPLSDDEKRKFLGIIVSKIKLISRALELLGLYIDLREHSDDRLVTWNDESIVKIVEEAVGELAKEKPYIKVVFEKDGDIPLIRTFESTLRSALSLLFGYVDHPEQKDVELVIRFETVDDLFVRMEMITSLYWLQWRSVTVEQLFDEPLNQLLLSRLLVESLDGRFEAYIQDQKLICGLFFPIWLLPDTVAKKVYVNLEDQEINLFLGQELEVIRVLEENVEYDISLVEVVECDGNIVAKIAQGMGQEGTYRLVFATVKIGSTAIKLRYSPKTLLEPVFYKFQVTVKPQTKFIE